MFSQLHDAACSVTFESRIRHSLFFCLLSFFFFPFFDATTRGTLQHCRKSDPMENFDCTQDKC